ncbi:MAG: N-acetyl-gamma-glutamyl-phosphate reductase, partial [Pseudomonadota bacterium]
PGCFPTAALLLMLPLVSAGLIDASDIVIDAKTGVSGAGRGLKEANLFCEVAEALRPYGVAGHRHAPEIEQEIARAAGAEPRPVSFTPHLVPMNRGELLTCHLRLVDGAKAADLRDRLSGRYSDEAFVHLLPEGRIPTTAMTRGSNHAVLQVVDDRIPGRAIAISALDNLVKGSAGQAIQNMNVMMGLPETLGLEQLGLFP